MNSRDVKQQNICFPRNNIAKHIKIVEISQIRRRSFLLIQELTSVVHAADSEGDAVGEEEFRRNLHDITSE